MAYVLLQIILAFYVHSVLVTLIIISFLFFLALERIFVHIWLDYERKRLKNREELIKKEIHNYRQLMLRRTRNY